MYVQGGRLVRVKINVSSIKKVSVALIEAILFRVIVETIKMKACGSIQSV